MPYIMLFCLFIGITIDDGISLEEAGAFIVIFLFFAVCVACKWFNGNGD